MNVEWNDVGMAHNMLIKSIFLSDWTQKGRQTGFPFLFHCSNECETQRLTIATATLSPVHLCVDIVQMEVRRTCIG